MFRDIVIARLVYPISKLKTVDYLYGHPTGYDIFEGNTFEGKTLLPVLQRIQQEYGFDKPVVVADAAMLSEDNLKALERNEFPFIVAARIRNETKAMQEEILTRCVALANGQSVEIKKPGGHRLIITYSDKRARKDAYNRGYNKSMRLHGEVSIEIDEKKIADSVKWDGLKGHLTNTELSPATVLENYGQLWHVEKAFRISNADLRIRPMYHRRRRRIEAHILIAFVVYTIYKGPERRLAEAQIALSPQRAAELTQIMYEMAFCLPDDPEIHHTLLQMDPDQQLRTQKNLIMAIKAIFN